MSDDGVWIRLQACRPGLATIRANGPSTPPRVLLATEAAASARALGPRLGTSTMVVDTHFGGMDELTRQVMRRGFEDSEPSWTAARSPTRPSPTGCLPLELPPLRAAPPTCTW